MNNLYEIKSYTDVGYSPVIDYETWRVAILNYIDELEVEQIDNMQRHDETDEVFILLKGKCILFIGDGETNIDNVEALNMKEGQLYNIKKGTFHTHTLSRDAMVLIVENKDTSDNNSTKVSLDESIREKMVSLTKTLWQL